jgi:hypothetical protein
MTKFVRKISENFHEPIHFLLGMLVGVFFSYFKEVKLSFSNLLALGVVGIIPDVEHLTYYLVYGRKHPLAKDIRTFMKRLDLKGLFVFSKKNHKLNTSLYLHNLFMPFLLLILGYFYYSDIFLSAVFFTLASHYIFDMLEDFLFLGKLNPNWLFKFGKQR